MKFALLLIDFNSKRLVFHYYQYVIKYFDTDLTFAGIRE